MNTRQRMFVKFCFFNSRSDFSDRSVFTPRFQFDVMQAKPTRPIELFFWNTKKKKTEHTYRRRRCRRTPRVFDASI